MSGSSSASGSRRDMSGSSSASGSRRGVSATVGVIVVAAGRGERLRGATEGAPKALVEVAGRTLLDLALTSIRAVEQVDHVVVVHPDGEEEAFRAIVGDDVGLVPGGETRTDSVRAGYRVVDPRVHAVAIHDAARPLVPPGVIARTIAAVTGEVIAAAPGLPVPDTLKRVDPDGRVVGTVDRAGLWTAHTPQVIRRDALDVTLAWAAERDATDDLGLVEQAIAAGAVQGRVRLVRGDPRDLKITFPEDLVIAERLVRGARPA